MTVFHLFSFIFISNVVTTKFDFHPKIADSKNNISGRGHGGHGSECDRQYLKGYYIHIYCFNTDVPQNYMAPFPQVLMAFLNEPLI
jgi:hypothetical protein